MGCSYRLHKGQARCKSNALSLPKKERSECIRFVLTSPYRAWTLIRFSTFQSQSTVNNNEENNTHKNE